MRQRNWYVVTAACTLTFLAWLSAHEGRTLVESSFRYHPADNRAQITADTLEFLGQCKIDED